MMAVYGGLRLSELAEMDDVQRCAFLQLAREIRARQRFEFIADVGAVFNAKNNQSFLLGLAHLAYGHDEETYSDVVGSISMAGMGG